MKFLVPKFIVTKFVVPKFLDAKFEVTKFVVTKIAVTKFKVTKFFSLPTNINMAPKLQNLQIGGILKEYNTFKQIKSLIDPNVNWSAIVKS